MNRDNMMGSIRHVTELYDIKNIGPGNGNSPVNLDTQTVLRMLEAAYRAGYSTAINERVEHERS